MFEVKVKREPAVAYESVSEEVCSGEIDDFVRNSIVRLRKRFVAEGRPFAIYTGCDKDDVQPVEVGLPTRKGRKMLPQGEVAYTVARGSECDYPAILSAYDAVTTYAHVAGRSLTGAPREIYLTDFDADGEMEMQICFPLAEE